MRTLLAQLISLCWLLVLSAGCTSTEAATEVIVVVRTDLELGSELDAIEVRVMERAELGNDAPPDRQYSLSEEPKEGQYALPLSFSVAPKNARQDFRIVVTGLRAGDVVVEQQAIASFVAQRSLVLELFLARSCLDRLCRDGEGQRTARACEQVSADCREVEPSTKLPTWSGAGSEFKLDAGVAGPSEDGGDEPDMDATSSAMDSGDVEREAQVSDAGGNEDRLDSPEASTDGAVGIVDSSQICLAGKTLNDVGVCQDLKDNCVGHECLHGGKCADGLASYSCDCVGTGFEGARCQNDVDECMQEKACAADFPCEQTVAPGYVCRGQFASWPMPDLSPGSKYSPKYDLSNAGVVLDDVTKIWWQRELPASYPAPCATPRSNNPSVVLCSAADAHRYCDALVLAGHEDWRLPSKVELESLVDLTTESPFIDAASFPGTSADWFWTSTVARHVASAQWLVVFWNGGSEAQSVGFGARARCMRRASLAAQTPVDHYQTSRVPGVVVDTSTKLEWQYELSASMTWQAASDYCASLPLAGGGFRLPTAKELLTLVDVTQSPTIDMAIFRNGVGELHWASTDASNAQGSYRRVVNFATGELGSYGAFNTARVRCVR